MVYYNEYDRKKAAWLRELIKANAIAKGEVDERSITDVRPGDLAGFSQCHFFAGIGIWSYALRCSGWPDEKEVWTGSCPCQPFSVAGKGEGTEDRRHLWPAWFELIKERKPVVVFGEQVSSPDALAWFDIVSDDMEGQAYTIGALDLCAPGVGAPHIRNRLVFVADSPSVGRIGRGPGETGGESGQVERSERLRASGGLADSPRGRFGIERDDGIEGNSGHLNGGGEFSGMGNTPSSRCGGSENSGPDRGDEGEGSRSVEPERTGTTCGMGNPNETGSQRRSERRDGGSERTPGAPSVAGGMGNADMQLSNLHGRECAGIPESSRPGPVGFLGDATSDEQRRPSIAGCDREGLSPGGSGWISHPGPVNGFWRDALWIPCKPEREGEEGRYRPVEPGTFPLAHGAPARVGRLRGYGDGIVAPLIEEFIRCYIEERGITFNLSKTSQTG